MKTNFQFMNWKSETNECRKTAVLQYAVPQNMELAKDGTVRRHLEANTAVNVYIVYG